MEKIQLHDWTTFFSRELAPVFYILFGFLIFSRPGFPFWYVFTLFSIGVIFWYFGYAKLMEVHLIGDQLKIKSWRKTYEVSCDDVVSIKTSSWPNHITKITFNSEYPFGNKIKFMTKKTASFGLRSVDPQVQKILKELENKP